LFVLIIVSVLEYTYNTQGRVVILLFFVSFVTQLFAFKGKVR